MNVKKVAVIGATGQIGTPLTKGLLKEGHKVTIITRKRSAGNESKLVGYENLGATVAACADMQDLDSITAALKRCDTLVACVPGSKSIIQESEPIWLNAAVKAGVERFVPTEFGSHTRAIEMGDGEIFDHKKWFHELLFESGKRRIGR